MLRADGPARPHYRTDRTFHRPATETSITGEYFLMNRKLLASAICASLIMTGAAFAQDNPAPQQPQDQSTTTGDSAQENTQDTSNQKPQTLESVTVTGSLLARPEYETVVPVQVVPIQAQIATGSFDTASILQSTAVAAGATQINNQFSGFVVGGGTGIQTIDLRGLGSNRTLVLMDGQRPGPAGTRGQTGAGFDLNVVPDVILQRVEIVKDGSSSIYGSDAISGVVNLITKKRLDHTEMTFGVYAPEHDGGEQYNASIGTGWNFDNGNIMVAAQVQDQRPLALGQRDYFKCPQDMAWGKDGARIDRADHSIIGNTALGGCSTGNLYANTIIDYFDFGTRYVPSPDGVTIGPFPGYRPRHNGRYDDGNPAGAYYEDVLNYPFSGNEWVINENRNTSLYASSLFTFGSVNWTNQFLYDHRLTETRGFRQFFPTVFNPNDGGYYLPIMPFTSNDKVEVDYYYLRTQLDGGFGSSSWTWQVNGTHSRSDGDYGHMGIDSRVSGDLTEASNTLDLPPIDYFDPCVLSGRCMNQLIDAVGLPTKGSTEYAQSTINAVVTGDMFELPAGAVTGAFGAEYRHFKIDDVPDPNNAAGYEWGFTSAQETKGADHVTEAFGEVGIPLLKGLPAIESLSADISARVFKYASVGDTDNVWKYGLNWQITPTWRVRGTIGTSYRAPALYELYLGNQSGFLSQLQVDPCILWGESTNTFLQTNCAAAGIPADYAGGGSSATVFQGGGKGFLVPETSRAKSIGFVWTPTFGNFNLALDYFDYNIRGEIGTLDAGDITFGCYGRPIYPNSFCNLFHRNPPDAAANANQITDIHATFININSERTRGYDLQMNYSDDFSFGKLKADAEVTYTIEDTQQLFSTSEASGFASTDFVGYIGRPKTVGLAHVSLERGDWTYTWQGRYVSSTENKDLDGIFTYFGYEGAARDIKAGWRFYHSVSAKYDMGKISILFGVRNLFDKKPDLISDGVDTRKGNVPLNASQYDWFGRTYFARLNFEL
jgi:iron complex outermembrane receptor protein